MSDINPIIFVHGIQGSWLKNQYPVDYQDEIYWTGILKKKLEKIHLSSIDQTVDHDIDKFIFPHQAITLAYESIVEELREEVTKHTCLHTIGVRIIVIQQKNFRNLLSLFWLRPKLMRNKEGMQVIQKCHLSDIAWEVWLSNGMSPKF